MRPRSWLPGQAVYKREDASTRRTLRRRAGRYNGVMKMRKKSDLPSKVCAHCSLPFTWRKKWERDWEQVKYCSERCRLAGKPVAEQPPR